MSEAAHSERPSRARRFLRALWRVTRAAALGLLTLGLVAGGAGWLWLDVNVLDELPEDLSAYRTWRPPTAVEVYDADGARVDQFYVERRYWVDLDTLPDPVWQAFVAAEDRRFFEHQGVDPQGILRALIANWEAGSTAQGGSTLTQQLVKNLIVGKERSYTRKLKEAVLAYRLERELGKRGILELYLNYVALGSGNYGVEAAARDYFGVGARDLDPGQAALLAGLVPAPSRYSPRSRPEVAEERRRIVLRAMVEQGFLDADVAAELADDPVLLPRRGLPERRDEAAYVTFVRREVRRLFGDDAAYAVGLQVHTPLRSELQAVALQAIRDAVAAHLERQGMREPSRRVDDVEAWAADGVDLPRDEEGTLLMPEVGACFEAAVGRRGDLTALRSGPWRWSLAPADRWARVRNPDPDGLPRTLSQVVRAGDLLPVCRTGEGTVRLNAQPWAEGAAVVLDHRTGEVLALVGGTDVGLEGYVRATQARRQPGSSFKPYVYAAALRGGHTQVDTVVDAPISLPAGGGRVWSPKNYGGGYAGTVSMRSALARSLNTVAVRLGLEAGPAEVARTATALGVRTPLRTDPTIALGSSEVTPMDQALGYAALARGGVPVEPVVIAWVEDNLGAPLGLAGDAVQLGEGEVILPGRPGARGLPRDIAYETADMLREVVRSGTARRAHLPGVDRAGKTGTTNRAVDAWFVGFTRSYTVAVWIGTDGTDSLGRGETGGRAALPAWMTIVAALGEPEAGLLPAPPEIAWWRSGGGWVAVPRGAAPASLVLTPRLEPGAPLPRFSER